MARQIRFKLNKFNTLTEVQKTVSQIDILEGYTLHQRLGYRLSRLSNLMKARLDMKLASFGLSRIGWCALSGIGLEHICTPSGIADHIGITRQATSRLLLQMRKDGLIEQSFDEKDGRSRRLGLTKQGQDVLDRCRPLVEENQKHFEAKLSPEVMATLSDALETLLAGEEAELDDL